MVEGIPPRTKLKEIVYEAYLNLGGKALNNDLERKIVEMLNLPEEVVNRPMNNPEDHRTQLENELAWCRNDLKNEGRLKEIGHRLWGIVEVANCVEASLGESASESEVSTVSCDFFAYLKQKGLSYDSDDIENFLLSIKAKPFVILSGGSGTGKTKLAQAYGEYISATSVGTGKRYRVIPVGSNWTDGRPVVGYRNALNQQYHSTPVLEALIEAEGSDGPMLLILDEMNLSHVERYFSDLLSAMESGEPVILDNPEKPELRIPGNLTIVGTVNQDETTYEFSPKVLDRANVIEFKPAKVREYLGGMEVPGASEKDVGFLQDCRRGTEVRVMRAAEILNEIGSAGNEEVVEEIVQILEDVQSNMADMGIPFGYRTLDEVMRFMYVAWVYEGRKEFGIWARYLDAQVMQKILPKVHGNQSIGEPLGRIMEICREHGLPESEAKLAHMIGVLGKQRYVSFNSRGQPRRARPDPVVPQRLEEAGGDQGRSEGRFRERVPVHQGDGRP